MDTSAFENTSVAVSKPAINPNIFGSVNNLHTGNIIDVLIEL